MTHSDGSTPPDVHGPMTSARRPPSVELQNDRTHDSTVDTDGKNDEAARIAGKGVIGPDEVTTSNASWANSVEEARDGLAGFDSRRGGNHVLLALTPGFEAVDKGMIEPLTPTHPDRQFDAPREPGERFGLPAAGDTDARSLRGRIHYAINHLRPARLIEIRRIE